MNCFLALLGLGVLILGIFVAFNIEFMWKMQKWGNSLEGVKSERTEGWTQMNGLKGLLLIATGIGIIIFSVIGSR